MRALFALACTSALVPREARADKMGTTLDVSLGERSAWVELDHPLRVPPAGVSAPAIDALQPHVTGTGGLFGAVGRIGITYHWLRAGIDVGGHGAAFLDLRHANTPDGLTLDAGPLWGVPVEGYIGYILGDADEVRLFGELRGGFSVLHTQLTLRAGDRVIADAGYNAYYPNFDVRLGVRVPITDYFFFEGGVALSPLPNDVGPERGSIFVALGLPIPLANL
jgi:hypothetical protein